METSESAEKCNLTFVIPTGLTEESCPPSLIYAFQTSVEVDLDPQWRKAEECMSLKPVKQDVFVCEPFEGDVFDYLKSDNFKCVVIGPRCLLSCLSRNIAIPELPSPIHNVSMYKLIITLSGFNKEEKEELRTIITRSSGVYSNNFSEAITHLVANAVGSNKYLVAVEKDVPIMTGEWLRNVWKAVTKEYREDISATDDQFHSFKCPVFKSLTICVSQMPRNDKEALRKKIEENGGTYSPRLDMSVTSLLIIPTAEGEKYEYAKNWRIQCLTPDWIFDSAECGHALDTKGYEVKGRGASTPTDGSTTAVPPDLSMCSTILNETVSGQGVTHIDETLQQSMLGEPSNLKKGSASDEQWAKAVDSINLQEALKARQFLDGCKIFVSGFSEKHVDKLRRILNAGGATRCQLRESVSHVIVGKIVEDHMNTISSWASKPYIVYADWIAASIKLQRPADETPFSYVLEGAPRHPSTPKRPRGSARRSSPQSQDETLVDEALINKYLKPRISTDRRKTTGADDSMNVSALPDSQMSTCAGIFHGKVFTITGYDQTTIEDYITRIREHSGEVVSLDYKGHVDYSVIHIEGIGGVHPKAVELVTINFLLECFEPDREEEPKLVDVQYYHLPLLFTRSTNLLTDCTFAISGYSTTERSFLISLATSLGAQFEQTFAKKNNPAKNVKASTHLICQKDEGSKYNAAVRWKIPAVTHNWLLACLENGERVPEETFVANYPNLTLLDGRKIIREFFYAESNASQAEETTVIGQTTLEETFTPVNTKLRSVQAQEGTYVSPSTIKTPDIETVRRMYPTPGVSRADDSLSNIKTPDTPYGCTWNPNPSAMVRKAYKRLLDSLPDEPPAQNPPQGTNTGTPVEEYYKRFQNRIKEEVKNYKMRTPVWIKKKVGDSEGSNHKDSDRKEGKLDEPETNDDKEGPLAGVVVCTAFKHQNEQKALYEAVTKLGGDYSWTLDDSVTHFIFTGQNNDKTKEFRKAREEEKFVVAPDWVWMCRDEQKRINEDLFPHTHNPKKRFRFDSKWITNVSQSGRPKKRVVSGDDKTESMDQEESENENTLANESLSKQLEEIEALASVSGSERRSLTRSKSISERMKVTPKRTVQYETQPATMDVPESQATAITWDDPQEREARQKLQEHITRDTQDIINDNMQAQSEACEEDKENLPTVLEEQSQSQKETSTSSDETQRPQYEFIISGVTNDQDRERYEAVIIGLGGSLVRDQYAAHCTHVVTARPSRSEKHLVAIACGKWILHPSFLEESGKAGRFLEESAFEWGNTSSSNVPQMDEASIEYKLAMCARRWRKTLGKNKKKKGAFHGMRALIHSHKDRVEAFTRLIVAGGGEVISGRPPYQDVEDVTHVFVEPQRNPNKIDLANFAAQKIPCLAPLYLNEYLVNDPPPRESECYIPEYKQILHDMTTAEASFIRVKNK